jgi:8-oxo-dGTP diphosphatase
MVGALIRREDGRYLVLQRSAQKDFGAGAWECVTGRVDQGESFTQALLREVREELEVDIVPEYIVGTMHFYRGEQIPEKEMLGIVYACSIKDPEAIKPGVEHAAYRWLSPAEAFDLFPADHWLGHILRKAETARQLLPDEWLAINREHGFEI